MLLGIGIGLAFAAMANLTVEAVPTNMTGIASAINAIMRQIGGAIGAQVSAAIVSAHLVLGGVPGRVGLHDGVRHERRRRRSCALLVTFAIPAREAPRGRAGATPARRRGAAVEARA